MNLSADVGASSSLAALGVAASRSRAKACSPPDEVPGSRAVLNAAALTYIAGFVAALGQLVYFFALSGE